MVIAFLPLKSSNQYITQMLKALSLAYPDAEIIPLPSNKRIIDNSIKFDIVWLNWYEILNNQNLYYFLKDFLVKLICLILWRIRNTTIISVYHNKNPHEMKFRFLNELFYTLQLRLSNRIIILSDKSKEYLRERLGAKVLDKIIKVPHPRYECKEKEYPEKPSKFNVLFFGLLRPYKNIELIIEVAKKNPYINFTIAGKPYTEEYGKNLISSIKDQTNVKLILKHITDSELDDLINEASILLLPYDTKTSLNSGVVYYACSKGINMIVPKIASIEESSIDEIIYTYEYNNTNDHMNQINKQLQKAYKSYNTDYGNFIKTAKSLRNRILTDNSIPEIAQYIKKLT